MEPHHVLWIKYCFTFRFGDSCFRCVAGLQELYMGYYNNFSSSIPATFGNLTNLVRLDMASCGLVGAIPHELGNLGQLDTLFLMLNSLEGPIPASLGNLVNLRSLDLSYNRLTGILPNTLIYLQKLELMSLMNNHLEGTVPDFLADLPNLEVSVVFSLKFSSSSHPSHLLSGPK